MSLLLEKEARAAYERIPAKDRAKLGGSIAALPDANELREYLVKLREVWLAGWGDQPARYLHLLLRLYHCVAFLYYEGNAFWAAFGAATGDQPIATASHRQKQINDDFERIARHLGAEIVVGKDGTRHYVQSAVRHVGIPVRVWRGFVEVCNRLVLEAEDWKQWNESRLHDTLSLWLGGRKNLLNFFVDNRTTATQWVEEMLEARRILEKNPDWTLDDATQVSHLRAEYFDEVPETALFLRPIETETLFRDRPRLRLRLPQPGIISIHLEPPRLRDEGLPTPEWSILGHRLVASTNPEWIPLHREAFLQQLVLKLVRAESELKTYRLRGLWPWGLWSDSSGAFISPHVHELPMDNYLLISCSRLDFANRDGWLGDDEDEARWNVEVQMSEGSTCFVSRLVPDARRAALEVAGAHRITFAPRARLELRVFARATERFFLKFTPPNCIALPAWPRFVMKAPKGLLARSADETQSLLQDEFRFFAGEINIPGDWRHDEDASRRLDGEDVFFFRVRDDWMPPTHKSSPTRVLRDLHDLSCVEAPAPAPCELTIRLQTKRHGVILFGNLRDIRVKKEPPLREAHIVMLSVPFSGYWPWYLLTATQDHATWEEIRLAFEMMNFGNVRLQYCAFQQIERHGMAERRGRCWTGFQNRIHWGPHERDRYTVQYSGLTDAIYSIVRQIEPLEPIQARWDRGCPPHLEIRFSLRGNADQRLREFCRQAGIRVMHESLWTR